MASIGSSDAASVEANRADNDKICFVIMPFGGWFNGYFESIYKPAIKAAGLSPRRADDLFGSRAIMQDIWDLAQSAKVILADFTGQNANVFYELGLAHAIAKPVVMVAQSMDDVPFDLRSFRIITFDKNEPNWGSSLATLITASLQETMKDPTKYVPSTFLKVEADSKPLTVSETERQILELRQVVERLDRQVAGMSEATYVIKGSDAVLTATRHVPSGTGRLVAGAAYMGSPEEPLGPVVNY